MPCGWGYTVGVKPMIRRPPIALRTAGIGLFVIYLGVPPLPTTILWCSKNDGLNRAMMSQAAAGRYPYGATGRRDPFRTRYRRRRFCALDARQPTSLGDLRCETDLLSSYGDSEVKSSAPRSVRRHPNAPSVPFND